jgi:hypothetical protein
VEGGAGAGGTGFMDGLCAGFGDGPADGAPADLFGLAGGFDPVAGLPTTLLGAINGTLLRTTVILCSVGFETVVDATGADVPTDGAPADGVPADAACGDDPPAGDAPTGTR